MLASFFEKSFSDDSGPGCNKRRSQFCEENQCKSYAGQSVGHIFLALRVNTRRVFESVVPTISAHFQ